MVILDAFFLSHTYEPVDVPDQDPVDRFLPPYKPRFQLDTAQPYAMSQMAPPTVYMEMRHNIQMAMERVPGCFAAVEEEFADIFGRSYGPVEAVQCEDADVVMVVTGTAASTCRQVIQDLRAQGEKAGLLKLKMFRPFPTDLIRQMLGPVPKVAVIDRNFSFGASGIFAQEIRAALGNHDRHPPVFGYIAGLGGRDITTDLLAEIYRRTKNDPAPPMESVWVGLNQERVNS
jgi:pyruvate/2-oxoacid:ferredoxin oxidoreductase alpha subunit